MPYKAKTHSQKQRKNPANAWRYRETDRPSAAQRGYGGKWRKASKAYLKKHPLCYYCLREGRTEASTLVDHVIPHKGEMKLFWDRKNWQPLCTTCHNSTKRREENKSAHQDKQYGAVRQD